MCFGKQKQKNRNYNQCIKRASFPEKMLRISASRRGSPRISAFVRGGSFSLIIINLAAARFPIWPLVEHKNWLCGRHDAVRRCNSGCLIRLDLAPSLKSEPGASRQYIMAILFVLEQAPSKLQKKPKRTLVARAKNSKKTFGAKRAKP